MSNYAQFYVMKVSDYGVIRQMPGVSVKVYNDETSALLATLTTDSTGRIVSGSLGVAAGTLINFSVEDHEGLSGTVSQTTFDAGIGASENLILDDRESETNIESVAGEVFWRYEDEPESEPQFLATITAGKEAAVKFDFSQGRAIRLSMISRTAAGEQSAYKSSGGAQMVFNPNTETVVPNIYQQGAAGNASLTVAVEGYTANAKHRKIQVSSNSSFSTYEQDVQTAAAEPGGVLNPLIILTRSTNLSNPETRYVRVAHSSNGVVYGGWSITRAVTFADDGGGGGTSPGSGESGPHKFQPPLEP